MKFETPPGITNIRLTKYGGKVCIWPVLKYWNSSRALLGIMLSNNFSCRYVIHCSCVEKLMVLAPCLCVKNPKWPPPRGCKKCKQNLLLPFFLIGGDYRYLQWTNKAEFVFYLINLCICKTWQKIYYNNVNCVEKQKLKKGWRFINERWSNSLSFRNSSPILFTDSDSCEILPPSPSFLPVWMRCKYLFYWHS